MDIKSLAESIEKRVGMLLDEIEKEKKTIIANARQDAMIELHNAKKLSNEIIDRANRYLQQKLKESHDITKSKHLDRNESLVGQQVSLDR